MERARRERVEFGLVETRRAVRQMGEIDHRGEFVERSDRTHGFRRPHEHRERGDRKRLDAFLAQRCDRERAGALGEAFAAGVGQEIVMAESRRGVGERLEYLDLHRPCW